MSSVKKGLALIIANADYQSQPQLPSCHKDGTDMKAKLEQLNLMSYIILIPLEKLYLRLFQNLLNLLIVILFF